MFGLRCDSMDVDVGDGYDKWAGSLSNVTVELPKMLHVDVQKPLATWITQFEAAMPSDETEERLELRSYFGEHSPY